MTHARKTHTLRATRICACFPYDSTDNGPEDPHVDMHAVGDAGPFRGRKRSLYEGGIRCVVKARGMTGVLLLLFVVVLQMLLLLNEYIVICVCILLF